MNSVLVCLGAGKSQVPVIIAAKNLGYDVIAIDMDADAPGFALADVKLNYSTHDSDSIILALDRFFRKDHEESPPLVGIVNRSSGPPVLTAALIAEHFNIPAIPIFEARSILHKDLLRDACKKNDIPSPKYEVLNSGNNIQKIPFDMPFVVKPALSIVGKSGVSVVRTKKQFIEAISYASKTTLTKKILVEDYIEGTDYSFIGFVENGEVRRVCILEEINGVDKAGKVYGRGFKTFTPLADIDIALELEKISQKIISSFNITRSPFMASFRFDQIAKLYLIEIHLDIGGDALSENLFPVALNINFPELAVSMAAGGSTFPKDINIKPSAVIFDRGSKLISERGYKIFEAETQKELDILLQF